MLGRRFRDHEHLLRVAALFLGGLLVFLFLKAALVPEGFGMYGHYRAGALEDAREGSLAFAGRATCVACHEDQAVAARGGRHEGVNCEACHGAQASHAEAEDPAAAKPQRPTAASCPVCHASNVAKPAGFPQVELGDHAEAGSCLECHAAHNPGAS
jgi:hypothetical protein